MSRNFILITRYSPDLGSSFQLVRAVKGICFNQSKALPRSGYWYVISMKCQQSFLRLHFTGKPLLRRENVGCFLRLICTEMLSTWGKTLYEKQQALVKGTSVPRENRTSSLSLVTSRFLHHLLLHHCTAPRENILDPGQARGEGFAFHTDRQYYPLDDLKLIL